MPDHALSLLIAIPALGALALAFMDGRHERGIRCLALLTTILVFALSLPLYFRFDPAGGMQFGEQHPWFPGLGIAYHVGVDGISLLLVLLTTFTMPLALLGAWNSIKRDLKQFHMALLLLEAAMIGVFVAADVILFYVFWEALLIPMALLIGIWGGPRRIYAAYKFFIYTMAASVLMLIAILYVYFESGASSFAIEALRQGLIEHPLSWTAQIACFAAFTLAFAVKVPMFPLHTWLPDAHVEAPTAGSVILAAVLLKMGGYGFLRFALPYFPEAALAAQPALVALALVGIVYGALMALAQSDIKKLVAYSSVSHLGAVCLGIFSLRQAGMLGGMYQMLAHGLSTGALFLLVGMIYDRRHTREIADFGGLAKPMPRFAAVFVIVTLSSIGLPGLNGFVGEFLILLGAFQAHPLWAAAGATGVVLGAAYMLWLVQRVFFGPLRGGANAKLTDLSLRELTVCAPILALMVVMGIWPQPFMARMAPAVDGILGMFPK